MASYHRQVIAFVLVTGAVIIYIAIGAYQSGGISTYWGRLPHTGMPLVVVTESLTSVSWAQPTETPLSPGAAPRPSVSGVAIAPTASQRVVLDVMNAERSKVGRARLVDSSELAAAAQAHANDMAARGYFDHTTPEGITFGARLSAAGIHALGLAENLGLTSFSDLSTVVASWMSSSTHRANVLGAFMSAGIGVASGTWQGHPVTFVVAIFSTAK